MPTGCICRADSRLGTNLESARIWHSDRALKSQQSNNQFLVDSTTNKWNHAMLPKFDVILKWDFLIWDERKIISDICVALH